MIKLEPCPYCGLTNDDHEEDCYFVLLIGALTNKLSPSKKEFAKAWNTRTPSVSHDELRKVIGEVTEKADELMEPARKDGTNGGQESMDKLQAVSEAGGILYASRQFIALLKPQS